MKTKKTEITALTIKKVIDFVKEVTGREITSEAIIQCLAHPTDSHPIHQAILAAFKKYAR